MIFLLKHVNYSNFRWFTALGIYHSGGASVSPYRKLSRPRDARALFPEFATRAARATWVKNHQLSGAASGYHHATDGS